MPVGARTSCVVHREHIVARNTKALTTRRGSCAWVRIPVRATATQNSKDFRFVLSPPPETRKGFGFGLDPLLKRETPRGFGFGLNHFLLKPEKVSGLV